MADEDNQGSSRRTLLMIMGGVVGGAVLVSLGLGIGYMIFGGSSSNPSAEVEQIIERRNPGTQPVEEQVSEDELVEEGEEEGSKTFQTKLKAFEQREIMMRKQRLTPDFPEWPATCFYPMNKSRRPGANWFTLPPSERQALMTEHGRTGMQFGGRVTQLITVSVGLDDWEWGVTLWASNPEFLKDIVYKMRFDEASAKYAEFGPFYTSYISTAEEMLAHCRITS